MRARPYRTMDNRIDGAVVAFFDIDPIKRSLELVNRARDYAEALVETVRESLIVLDENLRVRTANQSFYRIFQTTPLQTEGKPLLELWGLGEAAPPLLGLLDRTFAGERSDPGLRGGAGRRRPPATETLLLNARRVRLAGRAAVAHPRRDRRHHGPDGSGERPAGVRGAYRLIFETAREGIWLHGRR